MEWKLTVIIRDVSPLVILQEPVELRSVSFPLTAKQMEIIELKKTGVSCGNDITEQISQCFLEPIVSEEE